MALSTRTRSPFITRGQQRYQLHLWTHKSIINKFAPLHPASDKVISVCTDNSRNHKLEDNHMSTTTELPALLWTKNTSVTEEWVYLSAPPQRMINSNIDGSTLNAICRNLFVTKKVRTRRTAEIILKLFQKRLYKHV